MKYALTFFIGVVVGSWLNECEHKRSAWQQEQNRAAVCQS